MTARAPAVGFLFIGGAHQILHSAPVAAELLRAGGCRVALIASSAATRDALADAMAELGCPAPIDVLPTPGWLSRAPFRRPGGGAPKRLQLLLGRRSLRGLDVLVTAERTSTFLKHLPWFRARLVHIPHGAGDRAQGFERRIRRFDHVIVAGRKDRDRMVADGLVEPDRCSVSGYVKLEAVLRMRESRPPESKERVVLYNPHFAEGLGSWPQFGDAFARAVAAMPDHRFILAPHVRLAERLSPAERAGMLALAEPGRVLVDLGSASSCDMTYTLAADIYLGDVSSQVYEFLHAPKPCVFLNATGRDRRGDRDFASWRYGEVVSDPADLVRALRDAPRLHARFAEVQMSGVEHAVGPPGAEAAATAARVILEVARGGSTSRGGNRPARGGA